MKWGEWEGWEEQRFHLLNGRKGWGVPTPVILTKDSSASPLLPYNFNNSMQYKIVCASLNKNNPLYIIYVPLPLQFDPAITTNQ